MAPHVVPSVLCFSPSWQAEQCAPTWCNRIVMCSCWGGHCLTCISLAPNRLCRFSFGPCEEKHELLLRGKKQHSNRMAQEVRKQSFAFDVAWKIEIRNKELPFSLSYSCLGKKKSINLLVTSYILNVMFLEAYHTIADVRGPEHGVCYQSREALLL